MLKRLCLIFIASIICLPTYASVRDFLYPTYTSSGVTIVLDRFKGIYLIKPTTRNHTFLAEGISANQLAKQHTGGTVLVNAGYFGRDTQGFFPAGHLSIDPSIIDPAHCARDSNLCGYIFTDTLEIHEDLTFTKVPTITAGPIMMLDGVVNKDIQKQTSHRNYKRTRTILIHTKQGPIFLVSKKQYKLDRLLAYIVKNIGRNISVINLDGGSSTALWTDNPLFQVNVERRLPTYFILQ